MKTILLTLLLYFIFYSTDAQKNPPLKKHFISNSGCSISNYCEPEYILDYSSDSSKVLTGECVKDGVTYGVICIQLLTPVTDLVMAEDLLVAYADYLKESFMITSARGYKRGHMLNKDPDTRGILDNWEDVDNDKWKIKAWTDGYFIGFMFAYSKKTLPLVRVDQFLDGFRFPVK